MSLKLKAQVHQHCLSILNQKIETGKKTMDQFQEAANSETKSTAGDKHETARAMMQADREKAAMQLSSTLKMKPLLTKLNPDTEQKTIALGSLVNTDLGFIYVAIPLGRVEVAGVQIMVVSAISPIGHAMLGKGEGDDFTVNGKHHTIIAAF
jgi:transcription elongation GreA/GreB family factor